MQKQSIYFSVMKILSIAIICLISSCASYKIKDFEMYKPVKATTADLAIVKKSEKNTIAVVPFDEIGEYSKAQEVGKTLSNLIEAEIVSNKYGKVEDRNLIDKLKTEITLNELNSTGAVMKTPIGANYAISGKINDAGFSQSTGMDWLVLTLKILNGGKGNDSITKTIASVNVDANADIIELPSLNKVKSIRCKTTFSRTIPNGSVATKNDGIAMSKAILKCIDVVMPEVLKIIQPYSQITEKRIFEEKAIFKLDIGSEVGLKAGQKVSIKRMYEDGRAKDTEIESAYISNEITPDEAWIMIKDEDEARKVKLGDYAYILIKHENKVSGMDELLA